MVQSTTDAFSETEETSRIIHSETTNPFTFRDNDLLKSDLRRRDEDSMVIRFEDSSPAAEGDETSDKGWPDFSVDDESTGGIIFREQTATNQQVPTRCDQVTKSKFWADGSTTSSTSRYF